MKAFSIILFALALLSACNRTKKEVTVQTGTYYTCSMHPQVMELKPGKCPICHMDLIAVKGSPRKSGDLELTDLQIQLGNIQMDTMRSGSIGDEMVLNATLSIDQNRIEAISARVSGRIEKLYYKNIGDYVPKGVKLVELYSEELNNAKQEYIAAIEKKQLLDNSLIDFDRLIQSAKNKLLLWGMNETQISQLPKAQRIIPTTTVYSTANGYITSLDITEGGYVSEGGIIVRLADLSVLWAEAQLYSSQRSYIDPKAIAVVSFPDMPEKSITGRIDFENPEVSPDSRINLIRVSIPNAGNQLKPGMSAYVTVKSQASGSSLSLPVNAVLRDSKGASVWVKTGKNTFRNKMVTIGVENDHRIQITSGLQSGDVVVTSGAYLINSEYIFKNGAAPMAGMKM